MISKIDKLHVLFGETEKVGTIMSDPNTGSCIFEYDKDWLARGFSISPTELPLQAGLHYANPDKFDGDFAIFENSLPDGYGLYLINKILKAKGTSLKELTPLQRLSIIGKSGMGALIYIPVMPGFEKQVEITSEKALDFFQKEALKVLSEKTEGDASLLYYNSANSGGARPKAAYRTGDGRHWIVKFRHEYDPEDAGQTEYLYMDTARQCGINIPQIMLLDNRYFAIERFDIDARNTRYHTATAAALLKTDFRQQNVDYTNLLALTGYITQDPKQVEEMYRRMIMNIVCINKDDHAKNFSFIYRSGKWRLAPAYDITYSPAGSHGEHATSLYFNGNPDLSLAIRAGKEIRIPEKRCLEIIEQVESNCRKYLPVINSLLQT